MSKTKTVNVFIKPAAHFKGLLHFVMYWTFSMVDPTLLCFLANIYNVTKQGINCDVLARKLQIDVAKQHTVVAKTNEILVCGFDDNECFNYSEALCKFNFLYVCELPDTHILKYCFIKPDPVDHIEQRCIVFALETDI